jgi:hypothetical protein
MTSIARLMFDHDAEGRRVLDHRLGPAGLDLARVRVAGLAVDPSEVSGALLRSFDVPIGNLALRGWQQLAQVSRARERTAAEPGTREQVHLGEHRMSFRQSPVVEAWVGGASLEVLRLTLELDVHVTAVTLDVEGGRITRSRPGPARARAALSVDGRSLVSRELRPVDLSTPAGHEPAAA